MKNKPRHKRDFLKASLYGMSALGVGSIFWTLGKSMQPSADRVRFIIDLENIAEGGQKLIQFEDSPYLVIHRSKAQIDRLRELSLETFKTKFANNLNLSSNELATLDNRSTNNMGQFSIFSANCTHEHSIAIRLIGIENGDEKYVCHHCTARFDGAGRVFKRGAASKNLTIPRYKFVAQNKIQLIPSEII